MIHSEYILKYPDTAGVRSESSRMCIHILDCRVWAKKLGKREGCHCIIFNIPYNNLNGFLKAYFKIMYY